MVLHYCSLHQRLFSFTRQLWVPFSADLMQDIQGYQALLATDQADVPLRVLDRSCDHCRDTLRQIARVPRRRDPSP
jgi:hypothetical protein